MAAGCKLWQQAANYGSRLHAVTFTQPDLGRPSHLCLITYVACDALLWNHTRTHKPGHGAISARSVEGPASVSTAGTAVGARSVEGPASVSTGGGIVNTG